VNAGNQLGVAGVVDRLVGSISPACHRVRCAIDPNCHAASHLIRLARHLVDRVKPAGQAEQALQDAVRTAACLSNEVGKLIH